LAILLTNFAPVAFLVVLVDFSAFFVPGLLVRSVTKRLVLGETAHANPDRSFLRLNLERSLGGFEDLAHNLMVKMEYEQDVEPQVRTYCPVPEIPSIINPAESAGCEGWTFSIRDRISAKQTPATMEARCRASSASLACPF
jgi:hypothetical protein